ncbi:MAG: isochorismate synthase [Bacteroidota bacterium]|nr:isochorismate synthase [Bacteroidota bacterium]
MKVSLQQFFDYCGANNLPFAFYRLPGAKAIKAVAQKNPQLKKIADKKGLLYAKGFLFAPFKEDEKFSSVLITAEVFADEQKLPELNFATDGKGTKEEKFKLKEAGESSYKKLVKKIAGEINTGTYKKVVAARVAKKEKPKDFKVVSFFKNLCKKYPNVFVSLVYTPQYGLWIGASPEILLNVDSQGFKTYSLAGTISNKGTFKGGSLRIWGKKEKEEQKIVSDYIIKAFKSVSKEPAVIKGPETMKAGKLLHLRTTFIYDAIPHSQWLQVVEQLHPTPAVAGLPKKEAIDFIVKHEKTERGFYSGYLGPVNLDREINLYVNLRCMKVLKNKLALFVGCGITGDSKPVDEWRESEAKTLTLLSAL